MNITEIKDYIDSFNDYDIRKNKNCRYVDQKCTPDIISFIADCIVCTNCANKEFTCKDLWDEDYFVRNCILIFGKPSPEDEKARNEYNKWLSQPLKLLSYAHILEERKEKNILHFKVIKIDILEYIAIKERNAYNFMLIFFKKVISDSGLMRLFEEYEQNCLNPNNIREAKNIIYAKYYKFISANTPAKSKLECNRIFHKVFNIVNYEKRLPGSNCKSLQWYDLMYNRINWRDVDKLKSETRKESDQKEKNRIREEFYIDYQINKAIRLVKKIQGQQSEVHDELASGIATEVHHIFPKATFPSIATYFENLILLTSSQHRQKAHTNGNTQVINSDYQLVCLMAKSNTIEKYIKENGEKFYTKDNFIYIINTGLTRKQIPNDEIISFDEIRKYLISYYSEY